MNKKYIILGIACCFILVSGICYSCNFQGGNTSSENELTDLKEEDKSPEISSGQAEMQSEEPTSDEIETDHTLRKEQVAEQEPSVYVHICGAVNHPGVYKTTGGARVCDLIALSGGLKKEAAGDYINQAEPVIDGQRIYIPTMEEIEELTANDVITGGQIDGQKQETSSDRMNINKATAEEFLNLPGIGEAKADSIIRYRSEKGGFETIEELMEVPGIKEGLFDQISSLITVK